MNKYSLIFILIVFSIGSVFGQIPGMGYISVYKNTSAGASFVVNVDEIANSEILSMANLVVFEVDRSKRFFYEGLNAKFTVTCTVELLESIDGSAVKVYHPSFRIEFNEDTKKKINFRDFWRGFSSVRFMRVTVQTISCSELLDSWPPLKLYGEIRPVRLFEFDCNKEMELPSEVADEGDFVDISFGDFQGADEYELEWVFFNKESQIFTNGIPVPKKEFFRNDATRVTLTKTNYRIMLLYPAGRIYYRVRPIHFDIDKKRLTGKWTYGRVKEEIGWHQDNMNWQATTTFAEEGKSIPSIKYFDGGLKERQSVTYSHELGMTIVGQSVYDLFGRPTLSVMPAPTFNSTIGFDLKFALNDEFELYTYEDYMTGCDELPKKMNQETGASRYYSPLNPLGNKSKHQYIPNANGFPFSVTEFTNDNTGRIRKQGGVGEKFQLNGGHDTKYLYATADQSEIDRLFGNDVGISSHYFKNSVIDPNGQISISYLDMHGRTIATALAGLPPEDKEVEKEKYMVVPLDDATQVYKLSRDILEGHDGSIAEYSYTMSVTNEASFSFSYSLSDGSFNMSECLPDCYDCLYDLEITISGDCSFNENKVFSKTARNYTIDDFTKVDCGNPNDIELGFKIDLPVGEYTITRSLKISQDALDSYVELFLTNEKNDCIVSLEELQANYKANIDISGCNITCETCLDNIPTQEAIYNVLLQQAQGDYGNNPVPADVKSQLLAQSIEQYDAAEEQCNSLCDEPTACEKLEDLMIMDVCPGGQYWNMALDEAPDLNQNIVNFYNGSVFFVSGNVDMAFANFGSVPGYGSVADLSVAEFEQIYLYHQEWGESLKELHLEYSCKDSYCQLFSNPDPNMFDSDDFDLALSNIHSYEEAVAAGIIDPDGFFADPLFDIDNFFFEEIWSYWIVNSTTMDGCISVPTIKQFIACQVMNMCGSMEDCMTADFPSGSGPMAVLQWEMLKGWYLGHKAILKDQWFKEQNPECANIDLHNANAVRRLSNILEEANVVDGVDLKYFFDLPANDSGTPQLEDILDMKEKVLEAMQADCNLTCESMADFWLNEYAECLLSAGIDVDDVANSVVVQIRADLIAVCQSGCQANPPHLTSTAPDGTNSLDRVIGIAIYGEDYEDNEFCNPTCINAKTFLGSYEHPLYVGPLTTPVAQCDVDDCICEKLERLQTTYDCLPVSSCPDPEGFQLLGEYNDHSYYLSNTAMVWADVLNNIPADGHLLIINDQAENAKISGFLSENAFIGLSSDDDGSWNWADGQSMTLDLFAISNDGINGAATLNSSAENWNMVDQNSAFKFVLEVNCKSKPETFLAFLNSMSNTQLTQDELNSLLVFCEDESLEAQDLPLGLTIPPSLECSTCKSCVEVSDLVTEFEDLCGGANIENYDLLLSRYLNVKLGFKLTPYDYNQFFEKCNSFSSCGASTSIVLCPGTPSNVEPNPCMQELFVLADLDAHITYANNLEELRQRFYSKYLEKCSNGLNETFTVSSDKGFNEYQYTLYFYDQSGLLTKTIPPEGFNPLSWQEVEQVQEYRDDPDEPQTQGPFYPEHKMATRYIYNSLNQVVKQISPDGGESNFWYDRLGRLVVSQNAKQAVIESEIFVRFSYTRYDLLGRVIEVGEITKFFDPVIDDPVMTNAIARDPNLLKSWIGDPSSWRNSITKTYYDKRLPNLPNIIAQKNLRSRVASTTFQNIDGNGYIFGTHYSYDAVGNVVTLYQEFVELEKDGHRFKQIDYNFDLVSGKVNDVIYQRDKADQFVHHYYYDKDNKLKEVKTSFTDVDREAYLQEKDAYYDYYLHGPLARMELGEHQVQGVDYAYNLQGWMKVVNRNFLSSYNEMGQDGYVNFIDPDGLSPHQFVAKDAYGYALNYFDRDYEPISGLGNSPEIPYANSSLASTSSLFNGNIRNMSVHLRGLKNDNEVLPPNGYAYKYDQLHRIKSMRTFNKVYLNGGWQDGGELPFSLDVSYDRNGNIMKLRRNGDMEFDTPMDDLTYLYEQGKNRLLEVKDNDFSSGWYDNDFDGHTFYKYDAIGNLIYTEEQTTPATGTASVIDWTPYGKVNSVVVNGVEINKTTRFGYDAAQNRVKKEEKNKYGGIKITYYVRDAQGNIMSIYKKNVGKKKNDFSWQEVNLYGSSRLGTINLKYSLSVKDMYHLKQSYFSNKGELFVGWKRYELSNHLGNVLTTINDRKIPLASSLGLKKPDFFDPTIMSATDYYPFGMDMPGRTMASNDYRYGFNGKEKDTDGEWGELTHYDYGARIYNPSIGRWLSMDPLAKKYGGWSPYNYTMNSPIRFIDPDGKIIIAPNATSQKLVLSTIKSMFGSNSGYSFNKHGVLEHTGLAPQKMNKDQQLAYKYFDAALVKSTAETVVHVNTSIVIDDILGKPYMHNKGNEDGATTFGQSTSRDHAMAGKVVFTETLFRNDIIIPKSTMKNGTRVDLNGGRQKVLSKEEVLAHEFGHSISNVIDFMKGGKFLGYDSSKMTKEEKSDWSIRFTETIYNNGESGKGQHRRDSSDKKTKGLPKTPIKKLKN